MASLAWSTYVAPSKPVAFEHPAPRETRETWSPTSATLIYGDRDALLVDALLTLDEGRALADWIAAHDRNLTTIYITHGHGDHFFGAAGVLASNAQPVTSVVLHEFTIPAGRGLPTTSSVLADLLPSDLSAWVVESTA